MSLDSPYRKMIQREKCYYEKYAKIKESHPSNRVYGNFKKQRCYIFAIYLCFIPSMLRFWFDPKSFSQKCYPFSFEKEKQVSLNFFLFIKNIHYFPKENIAKSRYRCPLFFCQLCNSSACFILLPNYGGGTSWIKLGNIEALPKEAFIRCRFSSSSRCLLLSIFTRNCCVSIVSGFFDKKLKKKLYLNDYKVFSSSFLKHFLSVYFERPSELPPFKGVNPPII